MDFGKCHGLQDNECAALSCRTMPEKVCILDLKMALLAFSILVTQTAGHPLCAHSSLHVHALNIWVWEKDSCWGPKKMNHIVLHMLPGYFAWKTQLMVLASDGSYCSLTLLTDTVLSFMHLDCKVWSQASLVWLWWLLLFIFSDKILFTIYVYILKNVLKYRNK